MKKMIIGATLLLSVISVNAQKKGLQGTWFATCQFGYQQTKTGDAKSTNTTVLPIIGNFISPNVAIGIAVGSTSMKSETGSTVNANTGLLVVQPLVRKYWNVSGGLFFFGQLAVPFIDGKEKQSELKINQVGLSASGGFDMVLGKHFTAELSYNLANFSITTLTPKVGEKTTITDFSLAHVANVDPIYNGVLKGSNPTLTTPLSFGFKFLF
ncbi:unnamed protein product [Rotaria sp. Silwood1]|nr:unnamed protein product [Rotaria sp. Silwood1]CAF4762506.1 unnamed protein product [Rotaria sp. Silwood1]